MTYQPLFIPSRHSCDLENFHPQPQHLHLYILNPRFGVAVVAFAGGWIFRACQKFPALCSKMILPQYMLF
jgi:hypothetical protein